MHLNEVRIKDEIIKKLVNTPELHNMFHREPLDDFYHKFVGENRSRHRIGLMQQPPTLHGFFH
jgi:hypothetical protein